MEAGGGGGGGEGSGGGGGGGAYSSLSYIGIFDRNMPSPITKKGTDISVT